MEHLTASHPADNPATAVPHRRARRTYLGARRVRLFYFGLAALWGFIAGATAVGAALRAMGQPIDFNPVLVGALVFGGLLAVAGSAVSAAAYREARRRRSM